VKRREFITLLGGAAAAWPLAARAQQPSMPVIGFLHTGTAVDHKNLVARFLRGLKEAGYTEGQNVTIEYRWADNQVDRLPALAANLVGARVAVILSSGSSHSALAAKAATSTLPIVLAFGDDPVKLGLVDTLNRPGGNVTGVTFFASELVGKRLELLCELVPHATTVAYLRTDPKLSNVATEQMTSEFFVAARALGRQAITREVGSDQEFDAAFGNIIERQAGGLVVDAHPLFDSNRNKLAALAARHKIPAIYEAREYVEVGGLMSYGGNYAEAFRQGGIYVGQILKGAKPADLPFQQSTKFELVLNLKSANALGIAFSPGLLAFADEVVE
jgi:putative ABC transport system substrate-binding protein